MKNFLFAFLLCIFTIGTIAAENFEKYRFPNYVTVEEMKSLEGKTFIYYPLESSSSISGILGINVKEVTIVSVEGKTKKNKPFNKMKMTLNYDGSNKVVTYFSGNYPKNTSFRLDNECEYETLTLIDKEKWEADSKKDLGKEFSDPLVKAKYVVTGVYIDVYETGSYFKSSHVGKMYTIKNSISGEEYNVAASVGARDQFLEDKAGGYHTYLAKVEKPSNPAVKYGKTTTVEEDKSKGISKFGYEDNFINILIFGTEEQFHFTLKNVSGSTQKLIWDEAVFVDYKGSTSKVMHSGIRYSQRDSSQPASTIIKGASLDDIACPISNVRYSDVLKEWVTDSMYPHNTTSDKQVQLMLPIQIKDIVNEYIFIFDLKYKYKHPERLTKNGPDKLEFIK